MRKWAIGIVAAGFGLAPATGWAAQTSDPAATPPLVAVPAPAAPAMAQSGPPPAGTYVVHAIDVGTGLSIFVEGHDFTLLYDAGSNDDFARGKGKDRVLAYLAKVRPDMTVLDHLILSHPHKDHVEMMDDMLDAYEVRNVWDSGSLNDTCGYRAMLDAIMAEQGVVYHDALGGGGTQDFVVKDLGTCHGKPRPATTLRVPRGSQISSGAAAAEIPLGAGATMRVLHADGTIKPKGNFNEAAVVTRLTLGSRSLLLPGDGEAGGRKDPKETPNPKSTEGQLLACCAALLHSDILVASHHGSKTSSRVAFLDAIAASQYVVSVGPKAYSNTVLPDKEVIAEYTKRGTVWRTNLDDTACLTKPAKIGPDNDNKPGGCDNVRIVIGPTGAIAADYFRPVD
jgi:beta-lactamase superfamily II metal-dependent hydrolase